MFRVLLILALFMGVGWLVQDQLDPPVRVDQARADIVLTSALPATNATYGVASTLPSAPPDQMLGTVRSAESDTSRAIWGKGSPADAATLASSSSLVGHNHLNYVESVVNDQTKKEIRPACPGIS